MNVSLRQLQAFLVVGQVGGITRACAQLHLSQPGLSLMIQELETQLGSRLFERTPRAVRLTDAGQRLVPVAQRMLDDFSAVLPQVRGLSIEHRQVLSVGATPLFSSSVMPSVYQLFKRRHPDITLRLVDIPRDEVGQRVLSGELDCGMGIFLTRIAELRREPLFQFDFILIEQAPPAAAQSATRKRRRPAHIGWHQIPDGPYVELPAGGLIQRLINQRRAAAGMPATVPTQSLNQLETIIGMTAAGAGPSILPSFALPACAHFNVKASHIRGSEPALEFHLVTKRGRGQPQALAPFVAVLKEVVAGAPI